MSHTRWNVDYIGDDYGDSGCRYAAIEAGGVTIAEIHTTGVRGAAQANTDLMRAAPELLEAAKLAFEQLRPGNVRKDYSAHLAKAALGTAIAKAEGRL